MLAVQDMFLLVLGLLACFMGYSMFRNMLPLWGFLLGGWIAYTLLPAYMPAARAVDPLWQIGAFVAGGVVGSFIALPLYILIVFLTGAALGMLLGILTGAMIDVGGITTLRQLTAFTTLSFPPLPQSSLQYVLMLIFGLVLGGITVTFQKFMICVSSGFLGAAAVVTALSATIARFAPSSAGAGLIMLMGWIMLGIIGAFTQLHTAGDD